MEIAGELFHDAFRAIPVGIALENLEGQPLFVNPALCSFLGFSEEELRAKHCVDFSPPEDAQKDWALFEQLRAGAIDHYSLDKRFFKRDGSLVWGHLSISLLNDSPSAPLIVAMVIDITATRKAEETLRLAARTMVGVTRCSSDFRYVWASDGWADLLQRPLEKIVGRPIRDVLGAEAFDALLPYFERVLTGQPVTYEEETTIRGVGRKWLSESCVPTSRTDGVVDGWVAVISDITERKHAEEAIARLSGRLIQAQEEERSRIGRELHDDINQRLSLVTVRLDRLTSNLFLPSETGHELREITEELADLGEDIQGLSHRLHSSKIDYLGLSSAAASLCRELSARAKVKIDFHAEDIPKYLLKEISVCLFRVLQEGLQNATKYSGSKHFSVLLNHTSQGIDLIIHDFGIGFDVQKALSGAGIGLSTMRERLKLVGGTFSIESRPNAGATIRARVPLSANAKSAGT